MVDQDQQFDELFEANSKSVIVAYLLWLFFGLFNVHRFYAGKTKSGVVRLIMALTVVLLPIVALLWIIDLFLIPSMIGEQNLKTLKLVNAGAAQNAPALPKEEQPDPSIADLDPKRKAMLEELRATGYRKERRDNFGLYR
ncbi:MAG: TM2 domain-containing protein [Pseudomonadota bacterium]